MCPVNLLTGVTSAGSSASVKRVKSLGTCQTKILPSSEPEAITWSLKGCLGGDGATRLAQDKERSQPRVLSLPVCIQDNGSVAAEEGYLVG